MLTSQTDAGQPRLERLDALRGLAVAGMVLYHFCYDWFVVFARDPLWYTRPPVVVWQQSVCWVFVLLSGFVWRWGRRGNLRRGLLCNLCGVLITAVTVLPSTVSDTMPSSMPQTCRDRVRTVWMAFIALHLISSYAQIIAKAVCESRREMWQYSEILGVFPAQNRILFPYPAPSPIIRGKGGKTPPAPCSLPFPAPVRRLCPRYPSPPLYAGAQITDKVRWTLSVRFDSIPP